MAAPSDPDLLVLHGLRLRSFAPTDAVAEAADLPVTTVAERLERFRDKGWVRFRDGAPSGWLLLPPGRVAVERMLADELDSRGVRAEVEAAYRSFAALNQRLLQLCTDWQLRPVDAPLDDGDDRGGDRGGERVGGGGAVINDHADATYDQQVIASLRAFDAEAQPVVRSLVALLERFGRYPARFTRAVQRTSAGEVEWFDRPSVDSYHTVWFELHENLLSTLGIPRGSEEPA